MLSLILIQISFPVSALFSQHRQTMLIAPLFIMAAEGIGRMPARHRLRYSVLGILVPTVIVAFLFPGTVFGVNLAEMTYNSEYKNVYHYAYTTHDWYLDSLIAQAPESVPIAADQNVRVKLCQRERAFAHPFPTNPNRASYYIFDFFETLGFSDDTNTKRRERCAWLLSNEGFALKSHLDGILVLTGSTTAMAHRPFRIELVDSARPSVENPCGYHMASSQVDTNGSGYTLTTQFEIGEDRSLSAKALVSVFSSGDGDSIRLLHVPSYVQVNLWELPPGVYEETFCFDAPDGRLPAGARHEIRLYTRSKHLPFFARPNYLLAVFTPDSG